MRSGEELHNEKLHTLYRSPNIVRVIKSRRLRWAGRGGKILIGKPTEKRHWGGLGVDGKILEWTLKR